jgi:hypothetical protein
LPFAGDEHPPGMPPLCSPLKLTTQTLANVIYLGFCTRISSNCQCLHVHPTNDWVRS